MKFELKEVSKVEATGSLFGSAIQALGTWGAAYVLWLGVTAC